MGMVLIPVSWTMSWTSVHSSSGILSDLVPNIYFCFIDYAKAFDCVDHKKLENSERDGNTRPPDLPFEKPFEKQLELDMQQQTGSK